MYVVKECNKISKAEFLSFGYPRNGWFYHLMS